MAKGDVLVRMKADVSNYDANIAKARRALDGFAKDNLTMGGILKQTTGSLVAAAAKYASFAAVLSTVTQGLSEAVTEGSRMSKEMEGVKMAFDRLNQPGLLNNLREATHGTVNDLELMKQAVKFDNFGLSLEQMGTFLAFAQQQAKDTGQSVDYMVDSIVTGLGRKSLPILDNLGLSANEIREKMKETGDMTKAVAEIIQNRMEAAGGYIETASDRAAQAQANLDNAMIELGNTMNSLTGAGATLWSELETGAINLLNSAIKPLIRAFNALAKYINGPKSVDDIITDSKYNIENNTPQSSGKAVVKSVTSAITTPTVTTPKISNKNTAPTYAPDSIAAQEALVRQLTKQWEEAGEGVRDMYILPLIEAENKLKQLKNEQALLKEQMQGKLLGGDLQTLGLGQITSNPSIGTGLSADALQSLEEQKNKAAEERITLLQQQKMAFNSAAQAATNFGAALANIDDPAAQAAGTVIQAIANIVLGFSQAAAQASSMGPYGWIAYLAAGMGAMATTISTIHSLTGYAEGGMIKGNSYSGDNLMATGPNGLIGLNAGEIVLNAAQSANVAKGLQGAGSLSGMRLQTRVKGTELLVWLDNSLAQSGRGELVTWGQ